MLAEDLVNAFRDWYSMNLYMIALTALYLYDYFLTFADEVRYAWGGKKTWVFFLFLANRYIPMLYRVWIVIQGTWPGYTQELCNRTGFLHVFAYILGTWMAQTALAARVYAVTLKNVPITACLVLLSTGQLGLGLYHTTLVIITPTIPSQEIPSLRIPWCVISRHRVVEVTNTVLSVPFDTITFVVTIYSVVRQGAMRWPGKGGPSILRTLARDGALYFAVIFTSHVVFTFTLALAHRPFVQLIPAVGIHVYVPIMICRLMLSVRKTALACEGWESYTRASPAMPTMPGDQPHSTILFVSDTEPPTEIETINLDYLPHRSR